MSATAVIENVRFTRAAGQILWLVGSVRTAAIEQKNLTFAAGDDIWTDLIRAGQIDSLTSQINPWNGMVRAVATADGAMRVESDLPPHDCRRLILYFLRRQPAELGLLSIEAQAATDIAWTAVYPPPPTQQDDGTQQACGNAENARLALVFRIR
ncbi:MAG: hypothetical protein P4M13_11435 [Alphaproteobacteria bacterium]|nr:hypothetical protein [Alphaproteobacteria bacterium]